MCSLVSGMNPAGSPDNPRGVENPPVRFIEGPKITGYLRD